MAKPWDVIDADAFDNVDGDPPIEAGVWILSAVIVPCTVNVLPKNCKKLPAALSPNNISEPVIVPSADTLNAEEDISKQENNCVYDTKKLIVKNHQIWWNKCKNLYLMYLIFQTDYKQIMSKLMLNKK